MPRRPFRYLLAARNRARIIARLQANAAGSGPAGAGAGAAAVHGHAVAVGGAGGVAGGEGDDLMLLLPGLAGEDSVPSSSSEGEGAGPAAAVQGVAAGPPLRTVVIISRPMPIHLQAAGRLKRMASHLSLKAAGV